MSEKKTLFLAAVLVTIAIVAVLLITSFVLKNESTPIEQVKEQHESELMGIDGVTGVAIGKCESDENNSCIKVYLVNDSAYLKNKIPSRLDRFKVEKEVTGPITVLPK